MNDQSRTPASAGSARGEGGDHNIVDLVGRLTQQGAHLAREQVSLMQAEIREATNDIKAALVAVAAAAVFGIAGLGVLLMGLAYYLGAALENVPLGTVLVGLATLVLALILYAGARKKVDATNLKPERSIETLSDTPAAVTGTAPNPGGR